MGQPTLQTVTANGIEFAYYEVGTGPLVLMVHGFPDAADTWLPLMPALAAAGFRCVAPYTRGYAPTAAPEVPMVGGKPDYSVYSALELGRDVLALIDALLAEENKA